MNPANPAAVLNSGIESDRVLIDKIHYLTSLVSDPKAIDPTLDTMRIILARWDGQTALTTTDHTALEKLATDLKVYLVNKDPLRNFTLDSLEERVRDGVESDRTGAPLLGYGWAILTSALVGALSLLVPLAPKLYSQLALASTISMLCLTIWNAWFYWSALKNFKPELRTTFIYLCAGSVLAGVQFVGFVSANLVHWDTTPLHKYGGLLIYASVALSLIYFGLRRYGQLMQVQSRLLSLRVFIGLCAIAAGGGLAAMKIRSIDHPGFFGFAVADLLLITLIPGLAALTAWKVSRNVTAAYARSLRLIGLFCLNVSVGCMGYTALIVWRGELYGSALSTALAVLSPPSLLVLLRSGYSFRRETAR